MPALVEAAARHSELAAMVARLTSQILAQIETLLGRGIERGELRHDLDPHLAASVLIGPIVFRRLLLHQPPTHQESQPSSNCSCKAWPPMDTLRSRVPRCDLRAPRWMLGVTPGSWMCVEAGCV
jgi:Tetracyclin repressor-like, C-terminal domain